MARPKRRKQVITLERGSDGSWRAPGVMGGAYVTDPELAKTSPFLARSPAELETLQQKLNTKYPPEGVNIRPSWAARLHMYEHPPVPGSIGKWRGKGTQTDPYHWVGVSEKLAAYAALGLVLVWGAEVIETDISNWWSSSALNVGNDLTNLGQDILNELGFKTDNNGKSVGVRQHATFWSWLFQQVMVQGADLDQAVFTLNGVSTGFTSAGAQGGGGNLPNPPPSTPGLPNPPPHHQKNP